MPALKKAAKQQAGKPGIRAYAPEETRSKILGAAHALFQRCGYEGAGMTEIIAEAGMTRGALYHHFPAKKEIAIAVINGPIWREVEEAWILPVEKERSGVAGLRKRLKQICDDAQNPAYQQGCPLNNIAQELAVIDPAFQNAVAERFAQWRKRLAEKFESDQREGRMSKVVGPDAAATFIVAAIEGGLSLNKADGAGASFKDCAQQLELYFQNVLLKHE
jgi:AcrR family transcriptional regulator